MQALPGEVFKEYQKSGYLFSNLGRVWSKKNNKFLKPYPNSHNYVRVGIYSEGNRKDVFVHLTVVFLFGDKNGHFPQGPSLAALGLSVDHLNRNKRDNRVCNLEIVPHQENCSRWSHVQAEAELPF